MSNKQLDNYIFNNITDTSYLFSNCSYINT